MAFKATVRRAEEKDLDGVIAMIQDLADFENMPKGPQLTKNDLLRDGGYQPDSKAPLFYCFVAEQHSDDPSSCTETPLMGYAICYFAYSTWRGKALFLEDIYVRPCARNTGTGRSIFKRLAQFAAAEQCVRLDFHVLAWNPACTFYKKLGATDLSEAEQWLLFRMERKELDALLN